MPWVTPKDMGAAAIYDSVDKLTEDGATRLNRYKPGDIAVVFRSGVLRHTFPVAKGIVPFTVNQDLKVLQPSVDCAAEYVFHALKALATKVVRTAVKSGTTVESVDPFIFLNLEIFLPSLPEQQLIATILNTVDTAIRRTEQIIAKLELVKKGLLHDLLTRGIDENGELRDPEHHPEQFKKSELGRIPREWQLVPLYQLSAHITKGATPTTYGYDWADEGVLFLRSECVRAGSFDLKGCAFISEAAHRAMPRSVIRSGDLLMTITGYVGRSCRYPLGMPEANINQHIARIRIVDTDLVLPEFVMWALEDPRQVRLLTRDLTGLAYPQISLAQVQAIRIPVPPKSEQERLANSLDKLQQRLLGEESLVDKLRLLKKALMDDLLTGRVRVTPLLEKEEEEEASGAAE